MMDSYEDTLSLSDAGTSLISWPLVTNIGYVIIAYNIVKFVGIIINTNCL